MKITLIFLAQQERMKDIEKLINFTKTFLEKAEIKLLLVGPSSCQIEKIKEFFGASSVFILPLSWNIYHSEKTLKALELFHENSPYSYYLFSGSLAGKELAPRFSHGINGSVLLGAEEVCFEDETLIVKRGSFGQNLKAIYETKKAPTVLSISPAVVISNNHENNNKNPVIKVLEEIKDSQGYEKSIIITKKEEDPIFTSKIVLVGGRGIGRDGFSNLEKLGRKLNLPVGATRPVILSGLAPSSRMIGQSGINISPKTVITFGVSGSAAFLIGIKGAEKLIAINNDENAPIFSSTDIGILGDGNKIINELLKKL